MKLANVMIYKIAIGTYPRPGLANEGPPESLRTKAQEAEDEDPAPGVQHSKDRIEVRVLHVRIADEGGKAETPGHGEVEDVHGQPRALVGQLIDDRVLSGLRARHVQDDDEAEQDGDLKNKSIR